MSVVYQPAQTPPPTDAELERAMQARFPNLAPAAPTLLAAARVALRIFDDAGTRPSAAEVQACRIQLAAAIRRAEAGAQRVS